MMLAATKLSSEIFVSKEVFSKYTLSKDVYFSVNSEDEGLQRY